MWQETGPHSCLPTGVQSPAPPSHRKKEKWPSSSTCLPGLGINLTPAFLQRGTTVIVSIRQTAVRERRRINSDKNVCWSKSGVRFTRRHHQRKFPHERYQPFSKGFGTLLYSPDLSDELEIRNNQLHHPGKRRKKRTELICPNPNPNPNSTPSPSPPREPHLRLLGLRVILGVVLLLPLPLLPFVARRCGGTRALHRWGKNPVIA